MIQWREVLFLCAALVFFSHVLSEAEQGKASLLADPGDTFPSQELVALFREGDEFLGFKKIEGPTYYSPRKLFEYINGGAELFLSYGFRELLVVEFGKNRGSRERTTLEVYNMGSLESAFGIFKVETGEVKYRLAGGSEGSLDRGLLQFYKGKFYVKIFLSPQSKAYPEVVEEIGKTIEARIAGSFLRPAVFSLFPTKYRLAGTEKYTHKDFLGQPFFKRIASADFKEGESTYTIFISVDPQEKEAEKAFQGYRDYLEKERAFGGALKGCVKGFVGHDPYYGRCSVALMRGRIVGVLGDPERALSLLKRFEEGGL